MGRRIRVAICLWLVFMMTVLMPVANATSLQDLRWQNRLIAVFAQDASSEYRKAALWVTSNSCQLADRDVVVLMVHDDSIEVLTGQSISLDSSSVAALRQRRKFPDAAFEMLLVGKDGGVKARSKDDEELDGFLELIDAMPMRRREAKADKC